MHPIMMDRLRELHEQDRNLSLAREAQARGLGASDSADEWIALSEQLPTAGEIVLLRFRWGPSTGCLHDDGLLRIDFEGKTIDPRADDPRGENVPTHWRKIPLGPFGESLG